MTEDAGVKTAELFGTHVSETATRAGPGCLMNLPNECHQKFRRHRDLHQPHKGTSLRLSLLLSPSLPPLCGPCLLQVDGLRSEKNFHLFQRKLRHIVSEFVSEEGCRQVNLSDGVRQKTEKHVASVLDRLTKVQINELSPTSY